MDHTERSIKCADCGNDFMFTADEQKFFEEKGLKNPPKRCLDCRKSRRRTSRGRRSDRPAQLFDAVCHTCGLKTQVPFNPNPEKPVYCKECYISTKNSGSDRSFNDSSSFDSQL